MGFLKSHCSANTFSSREAWRLVQSMQNLCQRRSHSEALRYPRSVYRSFKMGILLLWKVFGRLMLVHLLARSSHWNVRSALYRHPVDLFSYHSLPRARQSVLTLLSGWTSSIALPEAIQRMNGWINHGDGGPNYHSPPSRFCTRVWQQLGRVFSGN